MRADIAPGGIFPDYELTDHTKTRRSLSELQGDDPLILVLARGHYCPKDHQQHSAMGGGVPLTSESQVIAGVGVSGGTTEQDIAIVEAAMREAA